MQLLKHKRAHYLLPLFIITISSWSSLTTLITVSMNIVYIKWRNFLTKAPHTIIKKMLLKFIHVLLMLHQEDEEARLQARHVLPSRQMNYCHFPCFTYVTWYGSLINIEYSKFLIYYTRGECGVGEERNEEV